MPCQLPIKEPFSGIAGMVLGGRISRWPIRGVHELLPDGGPTGSSLCPSLTSCSVYNSSSLASRLQILTEA